MAEQRAADHEPGEQPQMQRAILRRAQRLPRDAGQIEDRGGIALPGQPRNGAAERGAQPDRRALTVRGVVVAENEQVRRCAAERGEQRRELPVRVAPQHGLGRHLHPRVVVAGTAQRGDQGGERCVHEG